MVRDPRKVFVLQDVEDFCDDVFRAIEKLIKENEELKQRNDELVMLLDIEKRRNNENERTNQAR